VLVPTVTYGMNAIGLVPHMVFLVDFVARGLGRGMAAGAGCWVAFGLGALVGPSLSGLLADRLGFARTQRAGLLLQAACVALPALSAAPASLLLSATVIGAFTPGTVPLMLGRIHTQLPPGSDAARMAWRCATVAWALGQAAGGQAFSAMFARTGSYTPLFATAAAVLLAAFLFDVAATNRRRDWSTRPDA
jgi:predicted MFS family arabinose efflux permease